jgi:hypothetical protein
LHAGPGSRFAHPGYAFARRAQPTKPYRWLNKQATLTMQADIRATASIAFIAGSRIARKA